MCFCSFCSPSHILMSFEISLLDQLYTANLLENHRLQLHLYADNTQILSFRHPGETALLRSRESACVDDVGLWMRSNWPQLNTAKTEVVWLASTR